MNWQDPRLWLELLLVIWNIGLTGAVWLRKPGMDAIQAVNALKDEFEDRISAHAIQLTELRSDVKHMPTSEELRKVEGTVKELAARMNSALEGINAVRSATDRIQNFLLSKS